MSDPGGADAKVSGELLNCPECGRGLLVLNAQTMGTAMMPPPGDVTTGGLGFSIRCPRCRADIRVMLVADPPTP